MTVHASADAGEAGHLRRALVRELARDVIHKFACVLAAGTGIHNGSLLAGEFSLPLIKLLSFYASNFTRWQSKWFAFTPG